MRKDTMDLISLHVELKDTHLKSRYRLVTAAIKMAKQLQQGAMPMVTTKAKEITTVAIEEVLTGSVTTLTGDAAVKAQEEAGLLPHETIMDETTQKASFPDEPTDLEKEVEEDMQHLLTILWRRVILNPEFWKFLSFMRPQRFLTLWPFLIVKTF